MDATRSGKPASPSAVAAALASALDADDFESAAGYIAPDCEYRARGELLVGREAIIASYAASSAWGREYLTSLTYISEVESSRGPEVTVRFIDDLSHGGRCHRYCCRQRFTVGVNGLIERIVHEEIPGEREALEQFFRDCGLDARV